MSRGINKVIIVGNLGSDPESRTFPDGGTVSNISVATSDAWRDRNTGEMQERTEWHRIVLRDRGNYSLGQIAQQYLRKGSKVYVEGSLRTRKYTDGQGQERYITEIVASQLQMHINNFNGCRCSACNEFVIFIHCKTVALRIWINADNVTIHKMQPFYQSKTLTYQGHSLALQVHLSAMVKIQH